MNTISPIQELSQIIENCNIFIKREDLIPFSFGGNKFRIARELFLDMERKGCTCIIGYGNARSNLSRVIANMASAKGLPCYIVNPILTDDPFERTNNSKIVALCNAKIITCSNNNVAETVEAVLDECKLEGHNPYYINGDKYGKGNEKTQLKAYFQVYQEIQNQSKDLGLSFDYMFLPTGTGMTQGGLVAGKASAKGNEKIVGISISRNSQKERDIIKGMIAKFGVSLNEETEIIVDDNYLCGGYGQYNDDIVNTIRMMQVQYGIPLDPTYTGKAFWGMMSYIKTHNIKGNVLFIHTGGTPLYFDFI